MRTIDNGICSLTTMELEARESWRVMDEEAQQKFRECSYSQWPFGAGKLVSSGTHIVKVCIQPCSHTNYTET